MKKLVKESLYEGAIKIPDGYVEVTSIFPNHDNSEPGSYLFIFSKPWFGKKKVFMNGKDLYDAENKMYNKWFSDGSMNAMLNALDIIYYSPEQKPLTNAEWQAAKFNRQAAWNRRR